MRTIILFSAILLVASCSASKKTGSELTTATIVTSAQCGMCKTTIEGALSGVEGISSAVLDVTTKKLKVKYMPSKVSLDQIRQKVSAAGYDADEVPGNPDAYAKLPACCKKGGKH